MAVTRLSIGSDATWCRAWVCDTTAERTALLATYVSPNGPRRGDMILDNEVGQLFIVTNGGSDTQLTGLAVLPIDLTTDVTGILPVPNGGTGLSSLTSDQIPFGAGASAFGSSANLKYASGSGLVLNNLLDISGAAGGQIKFPATQNASGAANILDDYELGSWTPTLGGSGGQSGQAYTTQTGLYIKIGQGIWAWYFIALSTLGTVTTSVEIQSLPFPVNASIAGAAGAVQWSSFTNTFVNVQHLAIPGTSVARIRGAAAASVDNATSVVQGDLSNTSTLAGCLNYRTT